MARLQNALALISIRIRSIVIKVSFLRAAGNMQIRSLIIIYRQSRLNLQTCIPWESVFMHAMQKKYHSYIQCTIKHPLAIKLVQTSVFPLFVVFVPCFEPQG